uniref:B-cell receptor-associated protein 31-like n=1 Tax=Styela clava TaxID=7725 RepID=UPI0019399A4F|nr:B-cell receptor-associated protein 31-like [Styela clava]
MTFQWLVVSFFLYSEIGLCVLLCLPFIQPKRWQYVSKSRLLAFFVTYGNLYFGVFIAVLVILFADAVREVRKYSIPNAQQVDLKNNPNAQDHVLMMLFRAQRNLYITGFALFMLVILRRLTTLISDSATLIASNEAIKKQAESASKAAEALLKSKENKDGSDVDAVDVEELKKELDEVKEKLTDARKAETKAQNDLNAMKQQAEGVTREYDNLMGKFTELQNQVEGSGDKKDE